MQYECKQCGSKFTKTLGQPKCPNCGSKDAWVIGGQVTTILLLLAIGLISLVFCGLFGGIYSPGFGGYMATSFFGIAMGVFIVLPFVALWFIIKRRKKHS